MITSVFLVQAITWPGTPSTGKPSLHAKDGLSFKQTQYGLSVSYKKLFTIIPYTNIRNINYGTSSEEAITESDAA